MDSERGEAGGWYRACSASVTTVDNWNSVLLGPLGSSLEYRPQYCPTEGWSWIICLPPSTTHWLMATPGGHSFPGISGLIP